MGHLLGSEYCISSLQEDVKDLQTAITDILSRTGRVATMSWKYPDKIAADIDIKSILNRFHYDANDVENNQISHVVLLELIIDRLLLFVHCLSKFTDQTSQSISSIWSEENDNKNKVDRSSVSVGLAVKKHWNCVSRLSTALRQLKSESIKQPKNNKILEENSSLPPSAPNSRRQSNQSIVSMNAITVESATQPAGAPGSGVGARSNTPVKQQQSQTMETIFRSCELCVYCQKTLTDVSQFLIDQCKTQGLPTNLERIVTFYKKQEISSTDSSTNLSDSSNNSSSVVGGGVRLLTSTQDLQRWRGEMQQDLTRLTKHFQEISNENKQIKARLNKEEKNLEILREEINSFESKKKIEINELINEKRFLKSKVEELSADVTIERRRLQDLQETLKMVQQGREEDVDNLKKEILHQQSLLHILNELTNLLNCDKLSLGPAVDQMKTQLNLLQDEKQQLEQNLNDSNVKLDCARRQTHLMEEKQSKLVQRLEQISKENDELQDHLVELEEGREHLLEKITLHEKKVIEMKNSWKEQKVLIEELEIEREKLENTLKDKEINIQQLKMDLTKVNEEMQLILQYPDLYGPVNANLSETGNLQVDISNQIYANEKRIQLLSEENIKFGKTLEKLKLTTLPKDTLPPLQNEEIIQKDSRLKESEVHAVVRLWDKSSLKAIDNSESEQTLTASRYHSSCRQGGDYVVVSDERTILPQVLDSGRHSRTASAASTQSATQNSNLLQWTSNSKPPKRPTVHACQFCGRVFKRKEDLNGHGLQCGGAKK